MPYYIRVFSPNANAATLAGIKEQLQASNLQAKLSASGSNEAWEEVTVRHPDGVEICVVEQNKVETGSPGQEEIGEFLEEIGECQPVTAAGWLRSYLSTVKTIYAIRILFKGAERGQGWDIIEAVKQAILNEVGGVIQADDEGFTNEAGYHILWQFPDSVTGPWWMAVQRDGRWVNFQMELGNKTHRGHFFRGEVPPGVQLGT